MQRFFRLNETGSLDNETIEVMKTPRCGIPDVHNYSPNGQQAKWHKNVISYRHGQLPDIKEGPINNFMPGMYSDIDAAYSLPRRKFAYLFKGSKYWTIKGPEMKGGPKSIYKLGFPHQVKQIDAAVHINETGNTLFFIKDLYWSYNETARAMEEFYPRNITDDFPGISTKIDAAVEKNGKCRFCFAI
ncbi:UNVERIFIED_CONTAM: hypothetical protein FKN15_037111 [Acipenser sinensis]